MSYDKKQNGGWPSEPQGPSPPPSYGQPPQQSWGPPQQQWAPPPQQQQQQWGPPPSQQWGPPPSQQYGAPQPSPGPQSSQQWGQPPQQQWAPAPQQGDRQWGPPPQQSQQWGPPPQQNQQWGPPPPQQQQQQQQQQWNGSPPQQPQSNHVTFRFGGTKATILNTTVTDQYGRAVFTTSSDKKHTKIFNFDNKLVASVDWNHSSPVLHFQGQEEKVKKWMPITKRKTGRAINHGGVQYEWVENAQKTNDFVGPDGVMCTWHDDRPGNDVDVSHKALKAGLLEPIIISIVCLMSNHKLGDGGSDDSYIFGGAVAVALNAMH